MQPGRSASPLWPLLVALLGIVVYANAPSNGFALDDLQLVRDDPRIRSLGGIPRLFVEPYWYEGGRAAGLYRPVTLASLALDRAVTGPGPMGFHLMNVLLHGVVCAFVWAAARRAGTWYGTALLAGAIFAVHPIHAEVVANIAGRAELLSALGVLGAWLCHRRAGEARLSNARVGWAAGAAASYLFAVLSKEGAVLAPLLFLLDDALLRTDRKEAGGRVAPVGIWAAYGAAFLGMLTLRAAALGGLRGATDATFFDNPAAGLPALARAATALSIQARYLSIFSWPSRLSSDYSYDAVPVVHGAVDWRLAAGVAFALGIGTLLVLGWKRSRTMCLCAAIWTLFFLPASNLLFPAGTLMAERLAYLPSLGACLLLGHLGARFASSDDAAGRRWRAAGVIGVGAIAVLVLSARTWARTPEWRDNATLALADVETYPRSAKLQAGAGIVLHEAGKPAEAETHYRSALAIYPDYAQVRYNLGELLSDRGEKIEAVQQLIRAAVLSPQNPRPLQAIAKVIVEPGPDARRIYEEVLAEKGLPDVVRREASSRLEALEAGAPR